MRLDRHAAMAPQMKAEGADPSDDRHHSTKKKPNRDGHVLGRFSPEEEPLVAEIVNRAADAIQLAATGGIAAGLDDLPLFVSQQVEAAAIDPLAEAIASIDPDALTPREALEALYALKRLAADG